ALGPGIDCALAEACLGLADIHGARRALAASDDAVSRPWTRWLRLLDRTPGLEVDLPTAVELGAAPRAWAEIGLVGVRRAIWRDPDCVDRPAAVVRSARDQMSGAARRWVEIRLTALLDPERLEDAAWRREHTAGHPELVGLVLFERSLRADRAGQKRFSIRLVKRVMQHERSPGRRALMLVNLGGLLFDLGHVADAETTTLRAYRLFQAAGFRHRVHEAVHNLAVADLDALRVGRATARLDALSDAADPLFVAVERARLELAIGDLDRFRTLLADLPALDERAAPPITEALSLLHGVDALLAGDPPTAIELLRRGGDEAGAWLDLAAAAVGRSGPHGVKEDVWGMVRAASMVRPKGACAEVDASHRVTGAPDPIKEALALAVVRHLGFGVGIDRVRIARAARELDDRGLIGWAGRLWWGGPAAENLLTVLTRISRRSRHTDVASDDLNGALAPLGLTGLVLRSTADGRVVLRTGHGAHLEPTIRRSLELVPLGAPPVSRAGWSLLFDVLETAVPHSAAAAAEGAGSEVRMDGVSPAMTDLRKEIARTAPTRLTVLIEGETGSGKDVAAREIHRLSGRTGSFVAVNIAAVPAALLESELFGSVKGAYTGAARSRLGLVRSADGGTLFLDEIGDLDSTLQVKLLRFLESGEVRPVGSDRSLEVDVRVVCATHRNLERRVRQGRFREDLFYRIAIARLRVPALRKRPEDVAVLQAAFERAAIDDHGLRRPTWSAAAQRLLLEHSWPGNLRELRNCVEIAMSRAGGGTVRPEHLPLRLDRSIGRGTWETLLAEYKRRLLTEVVGRHHGNRSAAARELGISRQALLYQLKKLGLDAL
ncbi:MAG: sigma 54-interacting transcriptional regulator, partial [Holophagae bacterium]